MTPRHARRSSRRVPNGDLVEKVVLVLTMSLFTVGVLAGLGVTW